MTFQGIVAYLKKNYVIAASGAVVILCLGVHFVRNEQITRLIADYDDLNVRRSRILKNMKFGSDLETDLEALRTMKEDVESRLFLPADLASNQRYFYQVESQTGVAISNLQQIIKPLPIGRDKKKARKLAARAKYQGIVYDMTISGSYTQILDFMREVEGGHAFTSVDGFSVVQGKAAGGRQDMVTMRLSVEVLGKKA